MSDAEWKARTAICVVCGKMDFRCNLLEGDGTPMAAEGSRSVGGVHAECRQFYCQTHSKLVNCPCCKGTGKVSDCGRVGA